MSAISSADKILKVQTRGFICKHLHWSSRLILFKSAGLCREAFRIKALGAFPKSWKTADSFPLMLNTVFQYSWTFCLSETTATLMSFTGVYLEEGLKQALLEDNGCLPANRTPPPIYLRWLFCISSLFQYPILTVHFFSGGCVLRYTDEGATQQCLPLKLRQSLRALCRWG